jgi:hypothetical protein
MPTHLNSRSKSIGNEETWISHQPTAIPFVIESATQSVHERGNIKLMGADSVDKAFYTPCHGAITKRVTQAMQHTKYFYSPARILPAMSEGKAYFFPKGTMIDGAIGLH